MQGRGPRENIPEKVYICEFLKDSNLCVVSARLLRNVCTFLYLVYNSQAGIGINFINLLLVIIILSKHRAISCCCI